MADKNKKGQQEVPLVNDTQINMSGFLLEMRENSNSLSIVTKVIEETILQKAAEQLYNKYLIPKIRPYTAYQTME